MNDDYRLILACRLSGQVSDRQWLQHLENPLFVLWLQHEEMNMANDKKPKPGPKPVKPRPLSGGTSKPR